MRAVAVAAADPGRRWHDERARCQEFAEEEPALSEGSPGTQAGCATQVLVGRMAAKILRMEPKVFRVTAAAARKQAAGQQMSSGGRDV